LLLYKQGYESLTQAIKKDKNLINEKNSLIENLKNELERLKENNRLNICKRKISSNSINEGENKIIYSQAKKFFDKKEAEKYSSSEWLELLNSLDIKLTEIEKLSNNEVFGKIVEALEMLNKVVTEKNMQINLLMQENEKLNHKNSKLESVNLKQSKVIIDLKQRVNKLTQEIGEMSHMDTSMNNNISTIGNEDYIREKYKYNKNHVQSIQNINEYKKTVIKYDFYITL
jgi:hypothetical protein